ncbi:MAG: type II toxin-antitoxin system VapC family toxin [Candidatus Sumerlaeota bacterium]|nr:type II toxin-antitoxin system VapC family toxin [Candidatus Sumerlaeota bacterium]
MRKRLYIGTSIPSFYYEVRESAEMIARRDWTRAWWETRYEYELLTSDAVFYELERGDFPGKFQALDLLSGVPVVEVVDEIADIVQAYTGRHVMPADPLGDAFHLALASFHKGDFLLTWNCQNLANPNKFGHIRIVNNSLGLFVPELVTPYQLLEETR